MSVVGIASPLLLTATCKKTLQCVGGYSRIAELSGGAGRGGEALDGITAQFRSFSNDFQCGRFASSGHSLQSLYPVTRDQYLLDGRTLRRIQMWVRVSQGNGLLNRHDLRRQVPTFLHPMYYLSFCLNGLGRRELAACCVLLCSYGAKFPGVCTRVEDGANFRVGGLAHTMPQCIDKQPALIGDCLSLKAAISRIRYRFIRPLPVLAGCAVWRLALTALVCLGHYLVGLIPKLVCNVPMRGHPLGRR